MRSEFHHSATLIDHQRLPSVQTRSLRVAYEGPSMRRHIAVILPLTCVALMAVSTTAHAETLHSHTMVDPRGDVRKVVDGTGSPVAAPHQSHGDIRRTAFRHTDHALWLRMRLTDLNRTGDLFNTYVRLRTNTGLYRGVSVMAGSRRFFGEERWAGGTLMERLDGRPVNSCTMDHEIDYTNNVLALRIPRTCLGQPRWIRANARFTSFRYRGTSPTSFIDFAGDSPTTWTRRLRSP